jgi:MFS family permease
MTTYPIKLTPEVRVRLSAMMFLQFFIWGAWFVTLSTYLGQGLKLQGDFIGRAYSTMPWGAIVAPFLVGMIADRFFPAEKVLGILHLLGAAILYYASSVTEPAVLLWLLLAYALCYNPTLALVNAIAFDQLDNPEKQFPGIRVFGIRRRRLPKPAEGECMLLSAGIRQGSVVIGSKVQGSEKDFHERTL